MIALPPGAERWTAAEREVAIAVLSGETVVVNVRKAGPHKRLAPWLVGEGLLTYVGHAGPRHRWPESDFANPFVNQASTDRARMVARYREWLLERPKLLARIPEELAGRALGCWCAPAACHADVLAEEARHAGR
ncbi:DUF4326 domain-containing protein [Actinophytocola oryzae]|uniref:Uncharacterized protein DUF4326 n=1 Tax=Actinophytocola oryzae TaxID=502181 RepID=A0A4R7USN5_9PSEU|nr:DUF4326 domain-containing protein [Actinophytocola oryzae]TDV37553.1 uncharacterized protein DUF4326 [Actinophytocola oryzae]